MSYWRTAAVGSLAALGIASALIHPFGDVKGGGSREPLLAGSAAGEDVRRIVERACQSCHTGRTEWPWYSYVAPVSWMLEKDVRNGRGRLNFSRWSEYSDEERRERLAALGAAVRNRVMPLPRYLHLHPEAKLSQEEIGVLYRWTKSERRRLK